MKRRVGLGIALAACAAVEAAEPTPVAPPANSLPATSIPKPAIKKPLDLRVGDIRKYMMPDEFREALAAPDADKNTVVVEARRELLPVAYEKPIPDGPLMPLWWALKNPANSWRILLPDINRGPAGPPDVVPPPVFRRGP
ncbi:MAG TPA: hypothetical protein VK624_06125 [Steroidobacteraceae bacterium]|nr:hypothetical protein [Steroidobacteraceae bacterium]